MLKIGNRIKNVISQSVENTVHIMEVGIVDHKDRLK